MKVLIQKFEIYKKTNSEKLSCVLLKKEMADIVSGI